MSEEKYYVTERAPGQQGRAWFANGPEIPAESRPEFDDAQAGRTYLLGLGVPAELIVIEAY